MGWGRVGQHRSSGMRGGVGKAGLMKHKWTWTVKYDPDHFGNKGFTPPTSHRIRRWINVGQLDKIYQRISGNTPISSRKKCELDLTQLGYEKLLGEGPVKSSYKIVITSCSSLARSKVENAGGEIIGG